MLSLTSRRGFLNSLLSINYAIIQTPQQVQNSAARLTVFFAAVFGMSRNTLLSSGSDFA